MLHDRAKLDRHLIWPLLSPAQVQSIVDARKLREKQEAKQDEKRARFRAMANEANANQKGLCAFCSVDMQGGGKALPRTNYKEIRTADDVRIVCHSCADGLIRFRGWLYGTDSGKAPDAKTQGAHAGHHQG